MGGLNIESSGSGGSRFPPPQQVDAKHDVDVSPAEAVNMTTTTTTTAASVGDSGVLTLEEGWVQLQTAEGVSYYWNEGTGVTQWDPPTAATADPRDDETADVAAVTTSQENDSLVLPVSNREEVIASPQPEEFPESTDAAAALPIGWVELQTTNEETGAAVFYYLYEPDGTTQWERPTIAAGAFATSTAADTEESNNLVLPSESVSSVPTTAVTPPTTVETEISSPLPPLPDGWQELYTNDSDATAYYLYQPDGTTQWERPVVVAVASVAEEIPTRSENETCVTERTGEPAIAQSEIGKERPLINDSSEDMAPHNEPSTTTAALPPGWVEMRTSNDDDDNEGIPYYLYQPDGTTQWERPSVVVDEGGVEFQHPAPVVDETTEQEIQLRSNDQTPGEYKDRVDGDETDKYGDEEPLTTKVSQEEPLPEGWVEVEDADSGASYYVYEPDGTSTWDRPSSFSSTATAADDVPNNEIEDDGAIEGNHTASNPEPEEVEQLPSENELMDTVTPLQEVNDEIIGTNEASGQVETSMLLPAGWTEMLDADSGVPYYVNEPDGSTTWDRPTSGNEVADVRDQDKALIMTPNVSAGIHSISLEEEEAVSPPENELDYPTTSITSTIDNDEIVMEKEGIAFVLPAGWLEMLDEDSGLPYYVYEPDGTTTWDRPSPVEILDKDVSEVEVHDESNNLSLNISELNPVSNEGVSPIENDFDHPMITTTATKSDIDESLMENEGVVVENPVLPPGWFAMLDEDSGLPYYLYEPDGTTTWDRPTTATDTSAAAVPPAKLIVAGMDDEPIGVGEGYGSVLKDSGDDRQLSATAGDTSPSGSWRGEQEKETFRDATSAGVVDAVTNSGGDWVEQQKYCVENSLLPGWVELCDEGSGRSYYMFEADGTTTWDRPIPANNVDPADAGPNDEGSERESSLHAGAPDANQYDGMYVHLPLPSIVVLPQGPSSVVAEQSSSAVESDALDDGALGSPILDLPTGWSELVDENTGGTYYVCDADGSSTWVRPTVNQEVSYATAREMNASLNTSNDGSSPEQDGGNFSADHFSDDVRLSPDAVGHRKSSAPEDVANTEDESFAASGAFAGGEPAPTALPPGWVEFVDESSGIPYFYYEAEGITAWERPTIPSADFVGENIATGGADVVDLGQGVVTLDPDDMNATSETMEPVDSVPEDVSGDALNQRRLAPEDVLEVEKYAADEVGQGDVSDTELHGIDDLLPGWAELLDDVTNMTYYYCEADGSTRWDRPTTFVTASSDAEIRKEAALAKAGAIPTADTMGGNDRAVTAGSGAEVNDSAPEETGQEHDLALPLGWSEHVDPTSGQSYYVNETAGTSSWEWPTIDYTEIVKIVPAEQESEIVESVTYDSSSAGVSVVETKLGSELPIGWIEVPDPSGGLSYFYNEAENRTTWDRPCAEKQHRLSMFDAKAKGAGVEHSKQRDGRPVHAVVSFGFGGRLCQLRFQGSGRNVVMIRRTSRVIPSDVLVRVELSKQHRGLLGPLNASNHEAVSAYIESKASTFQDLLWCLIATVSVSQGRLRCKTGASDPSSPEAMIVKLLLRDYDAANSGGNEELPVSSESNRESSLKPVEQCLLRGQREQAVEEAISSGNFALALLIATMCSRNVYHHAAKCFADQVLMEGQPLHTIALLFSGQSQPLGKDESSPSLWDRVSKEMLQQTWKRQLALILSNPIGGWDQLVLSLGDRLADIGEVNSAHFCYMVCGCSVGRPVNPDARMTLLGCDFKPWDLVLATVDSIEGFERTEAYEWAKRRGNPNATIPSLQPFKVMYAMLLADFGFEQAAKLYIDNVVECLEVTSDELHCAEPAQGPLSLAMLTFDRNGLLAALGCLDKRLTGKFSAGPLSGNTSLSKAVVAEDNDANSSFLTAHTNFQDATQIIEHSEVLRLPSPKREKQHLLSSRLNAADHHEQILMQVNSQLPNPLQPIGEQNSTFNAPASQNVEMNSKAPPSKDRMVVKAPQSLSALNTAFELADASIKLPSTAAVDILQTPAGRISQNEADTASKASKRQTAPMSAPANLENSKKGSSK